MDTPERNQIGTPVSKIEESPFSNFVNSLSPINPIKTIVSQTFSSLSFTSPPSVFTSPHVSHHKEFRFLRRHQVSDLAKTQSSSNEGNTDSKAERLISADQQPGNTINEQGSGEVASSSKGHDEAVCNGLESATELPRVLKYDSGSPDSKKATSSDLKTKCEPETSSSLIPFAQDPSIRGSFRTELNSEETDHNNEESACDWQSLISGSADLFVFDSPNDAALKVPLQKSLEEETSTIASLLSRFSPADASDLQNSCLAGPASCNEAHETLEQSTQPTETDEHKQTDEPPEHLIISSVNEYFSGDCGEISGNEPFYNMHREMLRRCLVFEMPRAKTNIDGALLSSSSSTLQNEEKAVSQNKQQITPRADSSRCMLPGIGLHLNALAAGSKDCRVPNQEICSSMSQEPPLKSASASTEKDVGAAENAVPFVEESSQASTYTTNLELNSNSPKKKRRKVESVGEGEACKRCNCKKSKCLKLYCECFAAGVYCVEPCSCQDCFNKPIHEDTVLATRKQIESRNPLAFAPKVIRAADSAQELVGDDSTKTPASARHKRGCNCKKSNCLKKYCECYQGGVGCSINCRCEGCKNAFGRKDGSTLLGAEAMTDEAQACEKHIMDKSSDPSTFCDDEDQNSESALPKTPFRLFRSSIPLATSSKRKPPSSCLTNIGSSSGLDSIKKPGRSMFLQAQAKIEKHVHGVSGDDIPGALQNSSPPTSGIKTLSPNSKRISPPHHDKAQSPGRRSNRKLILQSIPSFPSLTPRR